MSDPRELPSTDEVPVGRKLRHGDELVVRIEGLDELDKVIEIDQSPIGRTPRSNPATYIGLFDHIRDLYSRTQEARARGYKAMVTDWRVIAIALLPAM